MWGALSLHPEGLRSARECAKRNNREQGETSMRTSGMGLSIVAVLLRPGGQSCYCMRLPRRSPPPTPPHWRHSCWIQWRRVPNAKVTGQDTPAQYAEETVNGVLTPAISASENFSLPYSVSSRRQGFAPFRANISDRPESAASPTLIRPPLNVASAGRTIVVSAEGPAGQHQTQRNLPLTIGQNAISNLHQRRSLVDFALLTPTAVNNSRRIRTIEFPRKSCPLLNNTP